MIIDNSAVLIAIATGIVTLFQFKKGNSLKYITQERQQWRTEIRAIMVELEKHPNNADNIQQILTEIKGRINAYGLNNSTSYKKDYHIWQIINQIEHSINSNDKITLNYDKQLLIKSLALLLKADWERSKNEIEGDKNIFVNNIMFLSSIITFIFIMITDFASILPLNTFANFMLFSLSTFIFIWIWYGPGALNEKLLDDQRN